MVEFYGSTVAVNCNTHLSMFKLVQRVEDCAARLVTNLCKRNYVIPVFSNCSGSLSETYNDGMPSFIRPKN